MYCGLAYCAEACGATIARAAMSRTIAAMPHCREAGADTAGNCLGGDADLYEREKGGAMGAGHTEDRGFIFPHGGPLRSPRYWNLHPPAQNACSSAAGKRTHGCLV